MKIITFILIVLCTLVSAQTTFNEKVLYRVARIISDTSLYSDKIKDVLPKFEFLDLADMSSRDCQYCYAWRRDKIQLYISFFGWKGRDSVLQQIRVAAEDIKSPVVDSINKIMQTVFITPPDTTFEQKWKSKEWKSKEYKHQSTNSTVRVEVYDKVFGISLSANTPEGEY